jgi:hypothetical protein
MPKTWLYYIALVFPFVLRLLVLNTNFVDWLWYHQDMDAYNFFNALRVSPPFLDLIGGWALPVYIGTICCYWQMDGETELSTLFLLLPLGYVPFAIIAGILVNGSFDASTLYSYPLLIIPLGYLYILPWLLFIWTFDKLRLVI